MLSIILEVDGVIFPVGRLELVPSTVLPRVVDILTIVGRARCPEHGEPSGAAVIDARAMTCTLEVPCCEPFAGSLASFV